MFYDDIYKKVALFMKMFPKATIEEFCIKCINIKGIKENEIYFDVIVSTKICFNNEKTYRKTHFRVSCLLELEDGVKNFKIVGSKKNILKSNILSI